MILVIDAVNRDCYRSILDDMFRLRARVFSGRLAWDVQITDGMEKDAFDALDPVYLVGLDADDRVISCVRLLQTSGPHMLADVFSDILQGQPPLRAPDLWESTRFCVDTERLDSQTRGPGSVARATSELMSATLDYARSCGISDIITVIDPIMNRVLKRSDNAPCGYVGATVPMGKTKALAALLDCTPERIAQVREFAGITGDVFVDETALRARLDGVRPLAQAYPPLTQDQLQQYCLEQLGAAKSLRDLAAAIELADAVLPSGQQARQPAATDPNGRNRIMVE